MYARTGHIPGPDLYINSVLCYIKREGKENKKKSLGRFEKVKLSKQSRFNKCLLLKVACTEKCEKLYS